MPAPTPPNPIEDIGLSLAVASFRWELDNLKVHIQRAVNGETGHPDRDLLNAALCLAPCRTFLSKLTELTSDETIKTLV